MQDHYRSVFISDLHLGARGCRARDIALFLKHVRCERLFLVGDILDLWALRSRWYWPAEHNEVIRRILNHVKHGTQVIYVPGNHDEAMRQYVHMSFGGVKVMPYATHVTADGRRLLVTHGDEFDLIVTHHRLLSMLGGKAYEWLIFLNRLYNAGRRLCGMRYYSLSKAIKLKVKSACTFISNFEEALSQEAQRRGLDGVVCGHIHKAEIRHDDEIAYFNCGDWVESCTALVEHASGALEIVDCCDRKYEPTLDDAELPDLPMPLPTLPIFGGQRFDEMDERFVTFGAAIPADRLQVRREPVEV